MVAAPASSFLELPVDIHFEILWHMDLREALPLLHVGYRCTITVGQLMRSFAVCLRILQLSGTVESYPSRDAQDITHIMPSSRRSILAHL